MPPLGAELRKTAIGMLEAGIMGMAARAVARHLNVHESTISRLRSRYQEANSTRDKARTGRLRVTTPAQDNHIRLRHLRNRQLTAASTARETPGTNNSKISEQTVRRRLREAGLRCHRPYFGAWCLQMTEDVVVCNGDAINVTGPSTIGRRFF